MIESAPKTQDQKDSGDSEALAVKSIVSNHFEGKAGGRRFKAEQISDRQPLHVGKNVNYAENCEAMASYVESRPIDHPMLSKLLGLSDLEGVLDERSAMHETTIHTGDKYATLAEKDCVEEFESWVSAVVGEHAEAVGELAAFSSEQKRLDALTVDELRGIAVEQKVLDEYINPTVLAIGSDIDDYDQRDLICAILASKFPGVSSEW